MTRRRWMNCLSSAVLVLAAPIMAQTTPTIADTQIQITTSLEFQSNNTYIRPINVAAEVISPFGDLRNGYTHQGTDLRLPIRTPIYAVADATVIKAAPDSKGVDAGGGHIIMLDHGGGIQTWYMHLDAYAVNLGDKVTKGQIIGFSGNSGESTTPHLHFEYRVNQIPIDPSFILNQEQNVNDVNNVNESLTQVEQELISLNEPFVVIQS